MRFESQSHQLPLVMESELDFWFPVRRIQRSARSSQGYTFARAPMGLPIRSPTPYSFADSLLNQNEIVIQREDFDPVYRGDIRPQDSSLPPGTLLLPEDLSDTEMSDVSESDEKENIPPGTLLLPEELSDTNMSDVSDSDDGESEIDELESSPAPAERLGSPFTPQRRTNTYANRMVTYDRRDRERVHAERAALATERLALEQVIAATTPRRSLRLQLGEHVRLGREGRVIHPWTNDKPRPVIDRHSYIMAVIVGAPKGEESWWADIIKQAFKDLDHLRRHGDFSDIRAGEIQLRLGVTFGEEDAARFPFSPTIFELTCSQMPHGIGNLAANLAEAKYIEESDCFNAISGYQNHMYEHIGAPGYARVGADVGELIAREIVFPAFEHSVFTTTEIDFGNVSYPLHKNLDAAFDTFELLTVLGFWNHKAGGGIEFMDGDGVMELIPGATVAIPTGTKGYRLLPIASHEKRYVFRQYCHASVLRWVAKGGSSTGTRQTRTA
ncbi:hypothetical protein B0H13DRAFT_1868288 [Mycena leptocephala]|nr:hypothetical protein B0H13DRAFT_1868288 [Mycena leptocephala]